MSEKNKISFNLENNVDLSNLELEYEIINKKGEDLNFNVLDIFKSASLLINGYEIPLNLKDESNKLDTQKINKKKRTNKHKK